MGKQMFCAILLALTSSMLDGVIAANKWFPLSTTLGRYSQMPLTIADAEDQFWERDNSRADCYNYGKFNGYRMIVKNDVAIGLLYDIFGAVAGIQMLVPQDIFYDSNDYQYEQEAMYQPTTVLGKPYWALTAYFIHPSRICGTGYYPRDIINDGVGDQVYLQNGKAPDEYHLVPISNYRAKAMEDSWSPQNCFDGMGYHNLMHVENFRNTNCTRFFPVLALYDSEYGNLQGFGFWIMGRSAYTSPRLEQPPANIIEAIMTKDAPPCILQRPTTTLHVFFNKDPASFKCPANQPYH